MRLRSPAALLVAAALATAGLMPLSAQAATPAYTSTPLFFTVKAGAQSCKIPADLYLPKTASKTQRVPAVLTTNGFGGSKDDQAGLGKYLAGRGYAVLSYSGLGFGGSTCKITLDDPAVDGQAASQLISYLAGSTGTAFLDAGRTKPAPRLDVVKLDKPGDPRVGMIGVSYGGGIQFATASIDQRLDTIVPGATWNDLSYSLSPNNTSQTTGVSTSTPGAAKLFWALGFSALGVTGGVSKALDDPTRLVPCPNFADFVCPALVTAGVTGTVDATAIAELRKRSVASYIAKVKIPTLLFQGQADTLFNLNEGTATFNALRKAKVPVKMLWVNGGHSGPNAPGEIDFAAPSAKQYVTERVNAWFDHYLKGSSVSTGPLFGYFRDWVTYSGSAKPAYATSATFPVGTARRYYLSGTSLTSDVKKVVAGSQTFVTPPAGLPTTTNKIDVVGSSVPLPEADLPGTAATWTTPALGSILDVVGSPRLDLKVSAPLAEVAQVIDAGKLVVFVRIEDVDAAGKATTVRNLVAPVRVPEAGKTFTVTMPAFVHRFAKGHSVRLVVAGGSVNYRGSLVPTPVTVATGSTGQLLSLPVVP